MKPTDWIEWTPDCCGKQDFDGPLVQVLTRYWPAGGSHMVFDAAEPEKGLRPANDGSKPHANCAIYVGYYDESNALAEKDFRADTEAEVKVLVEAWVSEQFAKIEKAINEAFSKERT